MVAAVNSCSTYHRQHYQRQCQHDRRRRHLHHRHLGHLTSENVFATAVIIMVVVIIIIVIAIITIVAVITIMRATVPGELSTQKNAQRASFRTTTSCFRPGQPALLFGQTPFLDRGLAGKPQALMLWPCCGLIHQATRFAMRARGAGAAPS